MKQMISVSGKCFAILMLSFITCSFNSDDFAVSKDGVKIRYVKKGQSEISIVFVHGFSGDLEGWRSQIDHFSNPYQVIAIDLPGFGKSGNSRKNWTMKSYGDDILLVIENLNLEHVILVGHSMGSAVIMEAAKQKTANIIGLVPCDVFHNVESKVTDDFIVGARKFYGSALKNKGWEEAFLSYVDWRNNQLLNCLKEMKVPIVCINSDRYKNEVEIARKYTSSFDIMIIEGVGHAVMTEAPDEFNQHLEDIIRMVMSDEQQ